jgi:hypothetical protein
MFIEEFRNLASIELLGSGLVSLPRMLVVPKSFSSLGDIAGDLMTRKELGRCLRCSPIHPLKF